MTQITSISHKNTSLKLSDQVKNILQEQGFSRIFNYSDYTYFKAQAKRAFNKAQTIAELFITENATVESDYCDYIF